MYRKKIPAHLQPHHRPFLMETMMLIPENPVTRTIEINKGGAYHG